MVGARAARLIPLVIPFVARRSITIRATRDGVETLNTKVVRVYESESNLVVRTSFVLYGGSPSTKLFSAAAVDRAWLIMGVDDDPPKRISAANLIVSDDVVYTMDFNDGTGGGGSGGTPATIDVMVRVGGVAAIRDVVAIEKTAGGEWRVAGSGPVASDRLDLRVTGGDIYLLAADDMGTGYQSGLIVTAGQTIRPSQYSGWLYRITEPGTLPTTEPQWWAAEGDNAPRLLGTARAIAVRYYQPLAHGPVPVEIL